jgi:hypothetical protein
LSRYSFLGECWAGNDKNELSKDGKASPGNCLKKLGMLPYGEICPSMAQEENSCQPTLCVGKASTNRVYELKQGQY